MSAIQMKFARPAAVELPCAFIDRYMPECIPVYALIYIYSLGRCVGGAEVISSQDIAAAFKILETDVQNAWRYWENAGLIQLAAHDNGMSVTFLPIPPAGAAQAASGAQAQPAVKPDNVKRFVPAGRPQYTVEELSVYRQKSKDIERLFAHAEQELGKLLTYNDMNLLFGFYDWLRLPVDVIAFLLTYCAERGHRDLRYVEKAAIDWAENQVCDVERALEYVSEFDREHRDILRAMGQTTGFPTPTQRKYIHKWLHEYGFTPELALEAIDRAATQIGKPKFNYVDKILEDWHKHGVRTAADAAEHDGRFIKMRNDAAKPDAKPRQTGKTNRFVNFKQRELDLAQLEKMEREYLVRSLNGSS